MSQTEESMAQQLYTPAMMAGLLKISPRHIRRWHRMGLLNSVRIAHRIPYFDYHHRIIWLHQLFCNALAGISLLDEHVYDCSPHDA